MFISGLFFVLCLYFLIRTGGNPALILATLATSGMFIFQVWDAHIDWTISLLLTAFVALLWFVLIMLLRR